MIARPNGAVIPSKPAVTCRRSGGSTQRTRPRTERRAAPGGYRLRMVNPRAAVALLLAALSLLAGCGTSAIAEPTVTAGRSIVPVEQFPPLDFAADSGRLHDSLAALRSE